MTDATQTENKGVSEDEGKELIADIRKSTNEDRMASVNELAEAAKAKRNEELGETTQINEDQEEDEETVDKSDESQEDASKNDEKLDNQEEMDILKVDGKEQSVEKSKIYEAGKRALQKDFTADTRLEEATRILREAKATAESASRPAASQPSSQDVDDTSPDFGELAKTLVDGDVDEVAKALGKLMGTGRQDKLATQAVNMQPNDVYGMVEGALQVQQAMEAFKKPAEDGGYGDLWKDEKTRQMVLDREADLAKEDTPKPPIERLEIAAGEVRQWRNDLIEASGGKVVDFQDRASLKEKAASTPSSAGATRKEQTESRPKTEAEKRKETLQKMSRARGQDLD